MHEVKKHQLGVKKVFFFTILAKKVSKGASYPETGWRALSFVKKRRNCLFLPK